MYGNRESAQKELEKPVNLYFKSVLAPVPLKPHWLQREKKCYLWNRKFSCNYIVLRVGHSFPSCTAVAWIIVTLITLIGIIQLLLHLLQTAQKAAAHLLTGNKQREHIIPGLASCPVSSFKILLFIFKSLNNMSQPYLSALKLS